MFCVVASASAGGADTGPVCGLVDGAGKARCFDECFHQDGLDIIALGPVAGQLSAQHRQDVGSEVWDDDPGQ